LFQRKKFGVEVKQIDIADGHTCIGDDGGVYTLPDYDAHDRGLNSELRW
jgi:hypothetical protein